jgi:hypothetical protein
MIVSRRLDGVFVTHVVLPARDAEGNAHLTAKETNCDFLEVLPGAEGNLAEGWADANEVDVEERTNDQAKILAAAKGLLDAIREIRSIAKFRRAVTYEKAQEQVQRMAGIAHGAELDHAYVGSPLLAAISRLSDSGGS